MLTDLECVKITLHLPGKEKVSVVAVYRPPNFDCSSFVSELDSILTTRNSDSYITCVVGDFNAKLSTWWNGQPSDVHGVVLSSLMYDHGLAQMVEGPTRFSSSSASQLDLIFIDNSDAVSDCLVLPPIADHCPTLLQLQLNVMSLSPQRKGPCKSWNFKLADFPGLNNFLKSVDWSPVYTTPDASAALTLWENILVSSMEQFIPFRTYGAPRLHSKPWFNSFLNRLRRKRNRLFSRSKLLDRNHPLSAAYRKIRNHYVAELRSAERQYYAKQVSALQSARLVNDSRRWWKTAKAACGLNSVDSIPPLLHNDCMKVTAEEKAACLNSVFAKQCNAQSPTSRSFSLSTNTTAGNFSFSRIEYPSVTKKLSTLNVWKACGNDGIPNRVLKECAATLAGPLTHIFNCSLQSGQFPAQWKRGEIKPLYNHKGTRSDPSCYRPVILLPCVSKVFESLVKDQLQAHCLNIHAIPDEQFGFLPHRSTVWQLLSVVDDWDRALDSGSAVHACFIDMTKAFDRVDHALQSHVLSTLGVSGIELRWFESYLHERSVCTVVEQHKSPFARISSGVPQGSVLGPLLFIIYYRRLPSVVSSSCAMFADDTLMYDHCSGINGESPCCRLGNDIPRLDTWASEWCTTFNASKSAHMLITGNRRLRNFSRPVSSLSISGDVIPLVRSTVHLGICLSSTLSWSEHITRLIHRVQFKVFTMKRLARRLGSESLVTRLFLSLVRPSLEYAAPAWDSCSKHDAMSLERVQLSVARAILRISRRSCHNTDVLRKIGWPTLAWRRRRQKLLLLWDLLQGSGPPNLRDQVSPASTRTQYCLRNPLSLAAPHCRTVHRLKSFLPSTVTLFNSLPSSAVSCSSKSSFKHAIDLHFVEDKFSFGLL